MRTWMRLRLARIQPNTASHTIRKRDSSSVQISGSPSVRVTTPSATQPSSATTSAHADERGGAVESAGQRREASAGSPVDGAARGPRDRGAGVVSAGQAAAMRSQSPLPHFDSNFAGTLASTGLRKLSMSGWMTVMPPVLNVSTSLLSCARISLSCVWPLRLDRGLEHLPLLGVERLPRGFVHDDEARRDDVAGQHQVLLHLEELVALDRRQRILLAVDRALAQRQIELADVERRRPRAPGLGHRAERVDLGDAQLEALHVVDGVDRLACPT